jgi:hypothetical protein
MVDYRKFDKIGDDEFDSDSEQMKHPPISGAALSDEGSQPQPPPPQQMTKKGKENRLRFEYQGQLIYEWEQSLEEVIQIYPFFLTILDKYLHHTTTRSPKERF